MWVSFILHILRTPHPLRAESILVLFFTFTPFYICNKSTPQMRPGALAGPQFMNSLNKLRKWKRIP